MSSSNYPSPKVHIMVDIETLDVCPTAVILSIGACTLDEIDTFYQELDTSSQYERTRSQSTIEWWSKQSIPMPAGTVPIKDVLYNFKHWISALRAEPIIWCKGTDFDVAILANAFNQYSMGIPWKYNHIRDMRTLVKMHPQITHAPNLNPHHALQDALYQARQLRKLLMYNTFLCLE